MIFLSDSAKNYISDLLNKETYKKILRISIVQGGCSGLRYKFEFIEQNFDQDESFFIDGINIIIAKNALLFVAGNTLNYKKTQTGSFLVFNSINDSLKCSCGISFYAK